MAPSMAVEGTLRSSGHRGLGQPGLEERQSLHAQEAGMGWGRAGGCMECAWRGGLGDVGVHGVGWGLQGPGERGAGLCVFIPKGAREERKSLEMG